MAKLKVRWTESAITEFGKMLTYYNVRNGNSKYSRSIVKMVRESLKLVAKFPLMYRSVDTKEIRDVRVFHCDYFLTTILWGFPCGSDGKESACNAGDLC